MYFRIWNVRCLLPFINICDFTSKLKQPFITPEIRELMKTHNKWPKNAIRTKDKTHWNAYRFSRQEVKREIRLAEKEYVYNEIHNINGNLSLESYKPLSP